MNFFKFLYDLCCYLTTNYSSLPDTFKQRFPETACINARLALSDFVTADSDINQEFKDYE